jgi:allantoate deiminase
MDWGVGARRLVDRVDALAAVSDSATGIERTFLSPAMVKANQVVAGWMEAAGMELEEDAASNLRGRWKGRETDGRVLLTGSHLDTVPDAGRYDGVLGVLLPILAVEMLREAGESLRFDLKVYGFADEEGVRFQAGCLGSKALTGTLSHGELDLADTGGRTLREVLSEHNGGKFHLPTWPDGDVLGYIEIHIEQGTVLEAEESAVGLVSGINAQRRVRVRLVGRAGHAGTTPMAARKDAFAGCAEFALAAERTARENPPLVVTIGSAALQPGVANVIPGDVEFTLDARHPDDGELDRYCAALEEELRAIAARRGLSAEWRMVEAQRAVGLRGRLAATLEAAVARCRRPLTWMRSGAGHDAMVMASRCDAAMLFVRCRHGVSHHPDEFVSMADLAAALEVYVTLLLELDREVGR